jgi:drug/metabolite transporter (DMT)-like permease
MRIAIAVLAALCAAFCFALGSLIQQGAARQTRAPALRFGLLVALAVITALTVLSGSVGLRSHGAGRVIWLAVATAVMYALVNGVTKSSVGLLMDRGAGVLGKWQPYTLIAVGVLSGLFGQSAFNAGPLSLSLPVIDTVEPVSAVILGAAVFGERLARSPGMLAIQLIGGAIAAAGIVVLSRAPVTLAEERRQSRAADAQPDRCPPPEGPMLAYLP